MNNNLSPQQIVTLNKKHYRFVDLNLCNKGEGLFDNHIDMAYIITMENSKRIPKFMKQLKDNKPYYKVKILYNKGYKNTDKILPIRKTNYDLVDANKQIFTDAKKNNYKNILILEDDIIFSDNYSQKDIDNIGHFINSNKYHTYNIGPSGVYLLYPTSFNMLHYRVFLTAVSQSIIYNENYYDIILNEKNNILHIDSYTNKIDIIKYNYHKHICHQLFPETENQKEWYIGIKDYAKFTFLSICVFKIVIFAIKYLNLDTTTTNAQGLYYFSKITSFLFLLLMLYLLYSSLFLFIKLKNLIFGYYNGKKK